ncbi:uncharacterized protein LOC132039159 [Lycium ferocissimum]|uniref:uncharacterized protein LOC132039159 n=1 Tax=Lycium ferocissimum TaxID=112874 RepID=UPI002815BB82|nr:uncharacterized protein LOC132039159 [Lycium ferocissimum]
MYVREYSLKFTRLARYATYMILTEKHKLTRFVRGLVPRLKSARSTTAMSLTCTFLSLVGFAEQQENWKGEERLEREQSKKARSAVLHLVDKVRGTTIRTGIRNVRNNSSAPIAARNPPAGNTNKAPNTRGNETGKAVANTANGGQARIYVLAHRKAAEASDVVVIGILTIFSFDAYSLNDESSNLSYVTLYFALDFGVEPELLLESFSVDTPAGVPVIVFRVYINYVVIVKGRETIADLFELEMVDFKVIMGMDWLFACYANVHCRHKLVRFEFPNEPVIVCEGEVVQPRGSFISYLKAHEMISKGCIYHLVAVNDTQTLVPEFESVPIVNEFPEVFPEDLSGIPHDRLLVLGLMVIPDTQPISIPPYRMALIELRELKD